MFTTCQVITLNIPGYTISTESNSSQTLPISTLESATQIDTTDQSVQTSEKAVLGTKADISALEDCIYENQHWRISQRRIHDQISAPTQPQISPPNTSIILLDQTISINDKLVRSGDITFVYAVNMLPFSIYPYKHGFVAFSLDGVSIYAVHEQKPIETRRFDVGEMVLEGGVYEDTIVVLTDNRLILLDTGYEKQIKGHLEIRDKVYVRGGDVTLEVYYY